MTLRTQSEANKNERTQLERRVKPRSGGWGGGGGEEKERPGEKLWREEKNWSMAATSFLLYWPVDIPIALSSVWASLSHRGSLRRLSQQH